MRLENRSVSVFNSTGRLSCAMYIALSMSEHGQIRKRHLVSQFSIPQHITALRSLPKHQSDEKRGVLRNAAKCLLVLGIVAAAGCASRRSKTVWVGCSAAVLIGPCISGT
jgi:hypothetical protein